MTTSHSDDSSSCAPSATPTLATDHVASESKDSASFREQIAGTATETPAETAAEAQSETESACTKSKIIPSEPPSTPSRPENEDKTRPENGDKTRHENEDKSRMENGKKYLATHLDEKELPPIPDENSSEKYPNPDVEKASPASSTSSTNGAIDEHNMPPCSPVASAHTGAPLPTPQSDPTSADSTFYPEGGLQAWLVVFGAFCGMTASFGMMNTVGVLQAYISVNQLAGYAESTIGWIFSLYIFLAFFCGLQIGPIFDAKGPRWLIFAGSLCVVGGTFGLANATEYWQFILAFSLANGIGLSLIFTPATSAIAHFFMRRRGLAIGLATTGGSIGGVVFPLLLQALFSSVGWAWSIRILGFVFLLLTLVANFLIRARLPPKHGGSIWPDFGIFRQLNFTILTAGVFFMEWGLFVPLAYISSWAMETGAAAADPAFAFQLLAVLNAASFFGRWLPGYAADKLGRFNTMLATLIICLVALLAFMLPVSLPGSSASGSCALAILFAVAFGFGSGSNISLTPVCVGELCDTKDYGRYYATCYTIVSLGCLTGVPISGELLQWCNGAYQGLIAFTAACYAASILCFLYVRVRRVGWRVGIIA